MNRYAKIFLLLGPLVLAAACANPAADKPKAVTNEAAPVGSAPASGEQYAITPANSKIEFVGSKVTGSHTGEFKDFNGAIAYQGQPESSTVKITIVMDSLVTDAEGLTQHLKTPDFFDVAKYPQATFESTSIRAGGEGGASHTVTGNLQMHGVTKSITFPATITANADAITVNSQFAINRKDFGINYPGRTNDLIRDEVLLKLNVRGVKG